MTRNERLIIAAILNRVEQSPLLTGSSPIAMDETTNGIANWKYAVKEHGRNIREQFFAAFPDLRGCANENN